MRQRGKVVRPIETPRLTAATVGVGRKMGEVLNRAGAQWEPRLLANLYAPPPWKPTTTAADGRQKATRSRLAVCFIAVYTVQVAAPGLPAALRSLLAVTS